ncbi:MAG: group 1 truncated hemoglobin [Methylotenera sp.]|nr:group 1 truncated hemoglobin [Methylotenera sp.]OQW68169.1 MAG: group 1 truncated hemoglobin [Proteobacteria bacterium ST_bin12]
MQIVKNKLFILLITILTFNGCSTTGDFSFFNSSEKSDASLFTRIGGLPVLTKIADEFIDKVATTPSTKRSFDGIKLKTLKESVVLHLCELTGGGCKYEGETMANSHRDAKITEAEFDAFVSMFRDTLNKYVSTREKNELLKILAPMKRDIVTPI